MTAEEMRTLYAYNSWANQRTLEACTGLTDEEFARDLGSSFHSVRDTLVHILGAQWLWLERWQGRSHPAMPSSADSPNLTSVRARFAEVDRDLAQFVAGLTAEDLARVSEYRTTKGVPSANPLWQSLQHLVNHSSYHRGQVTTMLRQLGAEPLATDLIVFYRECAAWASA